MNSDIFIKAKSYFVNGLKLFQSENYDLAEKEFLSSLELIPNRLSTIDNLIKIYIKTENKKKLDDLLNKFSEFKNDKVILAGNAYRDFLFGSYDHSIDTCNILIEQKDLEYQFSDLKASNFKKQKKFIYAIKIYKNLLLFNEKKFLIFCNIGRLLYEVGKVNQAKFFFEKSNKLKPKYYPNLWYLSLCNLTLGNFKDGFALYENRWNNGDGSIKKFQQIKELSNINNIQDKKILIWDEQGLGDTIQFSRFIIDLLKYTKLVTFVVNNKLKNLLNYLHPDIIVTDYDSLDEKDFDFQLPLLSLPKLLNTSSFKDFFFYKLSVPNNTEVIRDHNKEKLNIGIAWSGNKKYLKDEYRSIPFKYFDNILNIENINFYKLSKGSNENESTKLKTYKNIVDHGETNFLDLCSLLKKLDLVISSDTSIIHLAGILEIKSILLLSFNSDWRWFADEKSTIWYPNVEIIKQKKFNDWKNVFQILENKISMIKLLKN